MINLIKISQAVDELSALRRDDNRTEWLRLMICAKSVLRDMRLIYLNAYKKVYLTVNKANNTVRLPSDFYQFRLISVLQEACDAFGNKVEKPVPLTFNPYINIDPKTTPEDSCDNVANKPCHCQINSPVTNELSNFTVICEDVTIDNGDSPPIIATKQTVLRTCANGDIVKEVTQPVQKFKESDPICDYSITISPTHNVDVCDYLVPIVCDVGQPITITFTLNGVQITSPPLADNNAIQSYMESYGWAGDTTSCVFTITTFNVYAPTMRETVVATGDFSDLDVTISDCQTISSNFPYTISSYTINGITTELDSPVVIITSQAEQDDFFASLGFDKVSDTQYSKSESEDVYFTITITYDNGESPAPIVMINFNQECHTTIVADGYENKLFRDVLCNVDLKPCGCIVESQKNIDTIVSCCRDWLSSCQVGELTHWHDWRIKPTLTNTPEPYNRKGTFRLDKDNLLIYLDSVSATRVLLTYFDDGNCDGEFYIPDFCTEAAKAGIAYKSAQYDEDISETRREQLKFNYTNELKDLVRFYLDPIRITDLYEALKTKHIL